MDSEEYVIQLSFSDWGVFLSNNPISGSLILTNKRLIFGNKENSIKLDEIKYINIDTSLVAAPLVVLRLLDKTVKSIQFVRMTGGHLVATLLGDTNWAQTEVATYTSYWAALITLAKYQMGSKITLNELEALFEEEAKKLEPKEFKAWCNECKKYITIMKHEEDPIYQQRCPECGGVLLSKSPEEGKLK